MALKLSLILFLSLLFHSCIAKRNDQQQELECNFKQLRALEPTSQVQSEGGRTEFWSPNNQQFRCAGAALFRHTIKPKGLFVPSATNCPLMVFAEQGKGYYGVVLPGCPETFQTPQEDEREERTRDRHQKVQHFREGDMLVFHAGVVHWLYNNGNQDLKLVAMCDTSNNANQLDNIPQRFFLLGDPQGQQQEQGQEGQQGQQEAQQLMGKNILRGIGAQTLSSSFNVRPEVAEKLRGNNVKPGHIIMVERELQVTRPQRQQQQQQEEEEEESQQEQEQGGQGHGSHNGLEETSCSQKLRINLDNLDQADFYNPQAGHIVSLNSHHLPVLQDMQLSAERGRLHKNAMMTPHWNLNSHSILYATEGDARIQISNNQGQQLFNDRLQKGQVVVVPQNFAVVIQAGRQGFRWVAFKTNDNAMITPIAGRNSAFRGLPVSVIANILQMSDEEASKIKYNNGETMLFSPRERSPRFTNAFEKVLEAY